MYTKQNLIAEIENFQPFDAAETKHKAKMLELLNSTDPCFERKNFPDHITGSVWLVSPDKQSVLLMHHKFLNKWLQFGGHADGEIDIRNVAHREVEEESGMTDVTFVMPEIFDIDVHPIPENPKKNEPAHYHYDIRYLMRAGTKSFSSNDESNDLKWFTSDELNVIEFPAEIRRMIAKWQAYING